MQAAHCRSIWAGTLKLRFNHPLCSLGLQQSEQGSRLAGQCGCWAPCVIPPALGPVTLATMQGEQSACTEELNYLLP